MAKTPRRTEQQTEKLRALAETLERSRDAIIGATLDGVITSWNRGARSIYGYHDSEIIGKPVTTLVPADRQQEIKSIFQELRHGRTVENYETVRVTKAGHLVEMTITVSPVRSAKGTLVGVTAVCRDISAQKNAETALRESEHHYRLLFESNPVAMWVFDRATLRFLAVNEAAVRQYGHSRAEFLRMTIRDIRPEEDLVAFQKAVSNLPRGLIQFGIWRHKKKDGTVFYVEVTSHDLPFYGADAELAMAKDVTDRVQSDAQLRQSQERFSKAFRSNPLAVTISTEQGKYIDVNPAFLRLIKREREEVVGHTSSELGLWVHPADRAALIADLKTNGKVERVRTQFATKAGDVCQVLVSAELIELDDQPCILAITEDVTQAEQLERQFRQAQRMEAIGRLAGGVAHDFNNILGVILGYTELLQARLESDQPTVSQLEEIKMAAERAAALNRQLLAFSRQQLLQPRLLNLNDVIGGLGSMLRRIVGEDIELSLISAADLDTISADPTQVEQIAMNLVVNARDAMRQGGKLTIRTANVNLDQDYAMNHPGVRPGPYVLLSIQDTGSGIEPDVLPHIFEPFFTTKAAGEGTGLGLSTVYGIVKQSDGYIWVDTEPGAGTTFNIYFPRVGTPPTLDEPTRIPSSSSTGSETILVVEDDNAFRSLTKEILLHAGYKVLEAADPVSAKDVVARTPSTIDLLLTDVVMPKGDGHQLAEDIQISRPGIKVLYMSGYSGELLRNSREHMRLAVVNKPFSRNSLLAAVRAALES